MYVHTHTHTNTLSHSLTLTYTQVMEEIEQEARAKAAMLKKTPTKSELLSSGVYSIHTHSIAYTHTH